MVPRGEPISNMLSWPLVFFICAVIAPGLLGFNPVARAASGISQALFLVFLVLLALSFVVRSLWSKERHLSEAR